MPKTKEIGRNFREKTGGIFLPFSALQQTGNEIKRLVATRTISLFRYEIQFDGR